MQPLGGGLHHQNRNELLLRIDPEIGAGDATPGEIAHRARQRVSAGMRAHGKAQTKSDAEFCLRRKRAEQDSGRGASADVRRQVIGCHQPDRRRRQEPGAVQLATIHEHLGKTRIIVGGRQQSAAP